jgi:hypothetical protein
MDRIDTGEGFSVLDGAALVMGSAIASVHILRVMRADYSAARWVMVAVTFTWVAITAAGPFIFLARRFVRKLSSHPKIGDRLWALLGIPWLATAVIQSTVPGSEQRYNSLSSMTLSVGLAIVCMIALAVVWGNWVMVPPGQAARMEEAPWTNRVGLILSIAWPIQCGLAMVVLS